MVTLFTKQRYSLDIKKKKTRNVQQSSRWNVSLLLHNNDSNGINWKIRCVTRICNQSIARWIRGWNKESKRFNFIYSLLSGRGYSGVFVFFGEFLIIKLYLNVWRTSKTQQQNTRQYYIRNLKIRTHIKPFQKELILL